MRTRVSERHLYELNYARTIHVTLRHDLRRSRDTYAEIISSISNLFAGQTVYVRDIEGRFRERFREE